MLVSWATGNFTEEPETIFGGSAKRSLKNIVTHEDQIKNNPVPLQHTIKSKAVSIVTLSQPKGDCFYCHFGELTLHRTRSVSFAEETRDRQHKDL